MRPLAFVLPYALLFWAIYVWAFAPEFGIIRRARRTATSTDAKSLQVIVVGMWLALFAAFPISWIPALQFRSLRLAIFLAGCALLLSGSLLRRHCWRMLRESFTGDVQARADQQIVTAGAYRFLRHPSYTGGILMNIGVGLGLDSWAAAILLGAASFAVYSYRMTIEERALLAAIGEPYREFMHTRKRIIPFLY